MKQLGLSAALSTVFFLVFVELFVQSILGLQEGAIITLPQYIGLVFLTGVAVVGAVGFGIRFCLLLKKELRHPT